MNIVFTHESMDDSLMEEMENLWLIHWDEVANYQKRIQLSVDKDWYKEMQNAGLYQTITVRHNDMLIGYIGFTISTHPHYKDNIFASMDNVFIHKKYRRGSLGIKLFKEAENLLKELGVDVVLMRSKEQYDLSKIFEFLNYTPMEKTYSKFIGDV